MRRIICLGNRWRPEDSAGPRVYEVLARRPRPSGLEIVNGGLSGLDLIGHFEGARRVVLVDAVQGWTEPGKVVLLEAEEVAALAPPHYDHAAGLPYLLRSLPHLFPGSRPSIVLVGLEPPFAVQALEAAANLALEQALMPCPHPPGGR